LQLSNINIFVVSLVHVKMTLTYCKDINWCNGFAYGFDIYLDTSD